MQIVLFLTLGLLVNPSQIWPLAGVGLLISLFLIFVARPLSVHFCLRIFNINHRTRAFISWVGLRGAVPIVFATYPLTAHIAKAPMIFNLVFFITITSVMIQGTTLPMVAKWLHLLVPDKARKKSLLDKQLASKIKSLVVEFEALPGFYCIGKSIVDIGVPRNTMVVMINRNDELITPEKIILIEPYDKLIIMAENKDLLEDIYRNLSIGKRPEKPVPTSF
jgi:cell volume regulation protein A